VKLPRLTPRKTPKQDRSRALVDAVLVAAKRILVRDGDAARIVDVAELAGVSPGSLYQYFPSLPSIVATLSVQIREAIVADLADQLVTFREAPLEELAGVIALVPLRVWRDEGDAGPALRDAATRVGVDPKLEPVLAEEKALLTAFFESRPDLGIDEPELRAALLGGALSGLLDRLLVEAPDRLDDPGVQRTMQRVVQAHLVADGV